MQGDNASVSKGQGTPAPLVPAATNSPALEVKDPQLIFGSIWRDPDGDVGRSRIRFQKELIVHVVALVDEAGRAAREIKRGRQVRGCDEDVYRSGVGERWEERARDFSEGLASNRYRVFKEQTYYALVSLKQIFHYHFINAQAPI